MAGDAIAPGRARRRPRRRLGPRAVLRRLRDARGRARPPRGTVLGAAAGLLGAMYLFDVLGKLAPPVADLRWLSAFRYYGPPLTEGLDVAGLVALVVTGALLAAAGAALHARRDITG